MILNLSEFKSLTVFCAKTSACSEMLIELKVQNGSDSISDDEGEYGVIACSAPNACDGLMVTQSTFITWSHNIISILAEPAGLARIQMYTSPSLGEV